MGQACFVVAGGEQPSSRWMSYPAVEAGWPICKTSDADTGFEPDADVYVVQLTIIKPPIRRWHAQGKGVFLWIDDALWMMPYRTKQQEIWAKAWPDVCQWLREVDGVIAPSPVLAEDMYKYNRNSSYIPNYHGYHDLNWTGHWRDRKLVGYGGSFFHWISWRDTRCWLHLPYASTCNIVALPQLASAIADYRPDIKVVREDKQDPLDYLILMSHWSWQPIPAHGEYDRRRSWIKALEALLVGTAWTGYGNAVDDVYAHMPSLEPGQDPGEAMQWADEQHIRYHLDEWRGVLHV
jgi:hypothetical protein